MPDGGDWTDREPVQGCSSTCSCSHGLVDGLVRSGERPSAWAGLARCGDGTDGRPSVIASYEDLVVVAARDLRLPVSAAPELFGRWRQMSPWPDAAASPLDGGIRLRHEQFE
jgi:hypothetical protein